MYLTIDCSYIPLWHTWWCFCYKQLRKSITSCDWRLWKIYHRASDNNTQRVVDGHAIFHQLKYPPETSEKIVQKIFMYGVGAKTNVLYWHGVIIFILSLTDILNYASICSVTWRGYVGNFRMLRSTFIRCYVCLISIDYNIIFIPFILVGISLLIQTFYIMVQTS